MNLLRFSNWCIVSHGHDLIQKDDGLWVRWIDANARIESLQAALGSLFSNVCFDFPDWVIGNEDICGPVRTALGIKSSESVSQDHK